MVRIAIFVLLLFAAAFAFAWLADNPGSVTVTWPWLGSIVELTLLKAVVALATVVVALMLVWWVISAVLHSPQAFGRWRAGRRRDKGFDALSRGLIAAGAGNAPLAKKLSRESGKFLGEEPLVALLDAQTALLEGNRGDARQKFEEMTQREETKLLGLRGLYLEAEREGEGEAAAHFAVEANEHTPGTPWAAQAVLKGQAMSGNWEQALKQLEINRSSTLIEKDDYKRKRAVILTALAEQEEGANPDAGKSHALAAHKLEPQLVPAAVVAGRLCARTGDMRKAAKVLEVTWKSQPHPDIAEAYVNLRSGDSALDRLKRAETLAGLRSNHAEGKFAVAYAALDAGEWNKARDAMQSVLRNAATERACLLMADIEQAEHGDRGRVREWLARAVTAPRDAAWTADGIVAEHWAPVSPVTGQLGAFEWKVPVEALEGPAEAMDYSELAYEKPLSKPVDPAADQDNGPVAEAVVVAAAATVAAAAGSTTSDGPELVEDAEIIEPTSNTGQTDSEPAQLTDQENPTPVAANDETGKAASGAEPVADTKENLTPYKNANLDTDDDGVIDYRPDDPGVSDAPKKKAVFF